MTKKRDLTIMGITLAALIAGPRLIRAGNGGAVPGEERETETLAQSIPMGIHGADKHKNVTRELFLLPSHQHNGTSGCAGHHPIITLADALTQNIYYALKIPDDWVSLVSVKVVLMVNLTSGDIVWGMGSYQAAEGEAFDTHVDTDYSNVETIPATAREIFTVQGDATILADVAKGDQVGIRFFREGGNALDTALGGLEVMGLLITYIGEQ